jgi:hypothetical protein
MEGMKSWGREQSRVKKDAFEKQGRGKKSKWQDVKDNTADPQYREVPANNPAQVRTIDPDVERREGDKTKIQHHAPRITAAAVFCFAFTLPLTLSYDLLGEDFNYICGDALARKEKRIVGDDLVMMTLIKQQHFQRRGQHTLKHNDPDPAPRLSGRPADEEEVRATCLAATQRRISIVKRDGKN